MTGAKVGSATGIDVTGANVTRIGDAVGTRVSTGDAVPSVSTGDAVGASVATGEAVGVSVAKGDSVGASVGKEIGATGATAGERMKECQGCEKKQGLNGQVVQTMQKPTWSPSYKLLSVKDSASFLEPLGIVRPIHCLHTWWRGRRRSCRGQICKWSRSRSNWSRSRSNWSRSRSHWSRSRGLCWRRSRDLYWRRSRDLCLRRSWGLCWRRSWDLSW